MVFHGDLYYFSYYLKRHASCFMIFAKLFLLVSSTVPLEKAKSLYHKHTERTHHLSDKMVGSQELGHKGH